MRVIRAAVQYWAVVFAVAFAIGVVHTLWLAPWWGATPAVLAEVPLLLALSALVAAKLTRRHQITRGREAVAMGALAFALLMLVEALLAVTLAGQSPRDWFSALWAVPGIYGLAGQVGFGVMPGVILTIRKA